MRYVIGCDIGSQSTKAMLVSVDGVLIGQASENYPIDYPQPLWAEQPVEHWITALTRVVRRLLAETQVRAEAVQALSLAAQVDGLVLVDKAGRPLGPALIWMDRRAGEQCEVARQRLQAEEVFQLTGLNLDPSHVAPKIRWLADHQPELYEQAAYFLLPGSYLAYYLTGELAVDYSNASSTLLMDVGAKTWSAAMCAAFGIEVARLARLDAATRPLGILRPTVAEALGLKATTVVMIGGGDEHAACLGAGVVQPGLAGDIAGTAEPVCAASARLAFDPTHLIETHCHADPDLWLLENPGFVSGGNLRWYRDHFSPLEVRAAQAQNQSPYLLLEAGAARVPPGAQGVIFLPCLMGAVAPTWNESARGVFFGFTLAHTRDHFTRALLEGSAYAVRDITDQMQTMGLALTELRVVGGGAKGRLWNQIKADVTGLPVVVPTTTETTALGAALLALVGSGMYNTLAEACQQTVQIRERYEPQPETQAIYADMYTLYRQTYFALQPAFEQAAHLGRPPSSGVRP